MCVMIGCKSVRLAPNIYRPHLTVQATMLTRVLLLVLFTPAIANLPVPNGQRYRIFASTDDLIKSQFWDQLLLKATKIAQGTLVYVNSTKSVYQTLDEPNFSGRRPWSRYRRTIRLQEVQYGPDQQVDRAGIAISPCLMATLSSENMSYSQGLSWDLSFDVDVGPAASYYYGTTALGAAISADAELLSTTVSQAGSIKCQPVANGSVQVFGTMFLRYFPHARQRITTYSIRKRVFLASLWKNVTTKSGGKQTVGALFYDFSRLPTMECVTSPELQRCDDVASLLDSVWWPAESEESDENEEEDKDQQQNEDENDDEFVTENGADDNTPEVMIGEPSASLNATHS